MGSGLKCVLSLKLILNPQLKNWRHAAPDPFSTPDHMGKHR